MNCLPHLPLLEIWFCWDACLDVTNAPSMVQIMVVNILNLLLNILFVIGFGMKIDELHWPLSRPMVGIASSLASLAGDGGKCYAA